MTFKLPTHKIAGITFDQWQTGDIEVAISYRERGRKDRKFWIDKRRAVRLCAFLRRCPGFVEMKATNGRLSSFWYNPYQTGDLPADRVLAALLRFRNKIAAGAVLDAYDITDTGSKETSCSWGLCSKSLEDWPEPADHIFPLEMIENGRSSPKYQGGYQCPFDQPWPEGHKNAGSNAKGNGCFHRCLIFQRRLIKPGGGPMTQEQALDLYDVKIKLAGGDQ